MNKGLVLGISATIIGLIMLGFGFANMTWEASPPTKHICSTIQHMNSTHTTTVKECHDESPKIKVHLSVMMLILWGAVIFSVGLGVTLGNVLSH